MCLFVYEFKLFSDDILRLSDAVFNFFSGLISVCELNDNGDLKLFVDELSPKIILNAESLSTS